MGREELKPIKFSAIKCGRYFTARGVVCRKAKVYTSGSAPVLIAETILDGNAIPIAPDEIVRPIDKRDLDEALRRITYSKEMYGSHNALPQKVSAYEKFIYAARILKAEQRKADLPMVNKTNTDESLPMVKEHPIFVVRKLLSCRISLVSAAAAFNRLPSTKRKEFKAWASEREGLTQREIEEKVKRM